jgi:hypothetical protein
MQTFLAYDAHLDTAQCLDRSRLGKQRVEAIQLLNAGHDLFYDHDLKRVVDRPAKGWQNVAVTRAWRPYPLALVAYGLTMCREWTRRGYVDNCSRQFAAYAEYFRDTGEEYVEPDWWINAPMRYAIIRSHRSNLIRKDPGYYGKMWPNIPPDLEYVWPD